MGMIFDIKRYAIHDGPGIRTTVFLKGCPLNCRWCHNPEGKSREQEFMWWRGRCIGCKNCQSACTKGAVSFSDTTLALDGRKCDLCGMCVDVCIPQALELIGREMTADQVLKEIERDTIFYDESGGGVTLSGGEPLMQSEFTHDLLKACKELGIHTAVDTCGYAESDILLEISEHVDVFLYDLKVMNDEKHRKLTGVSNSLILWNLKELSQKGRSIVVRFPLVPGENDDEKDVLELGEYVSSLGNVEELSILPYHTAGDEKTKRLVTPRDSSGMNHPVPLETLRKTEEILKTFGLRIQRGA